ncbi:MAG: flagellar basal body P-ring formation protein FlgA [Phycisphaerales bacterium]|nr:flagellar basal body P-ring formation protein FlgA [Phycisphaerales bacterium]
MSVVARAVVLVLLAAAHGARGQDSVRLRAASRVPEGVVVTLADVAVLSGPGAEALGGVAVAPTGEPPTVGVADVRRALAALPRGRVNWGRLALSGSACRIVRPAPAASSAPAPAVPAPLSGTVRHLIPSRVAQLLGVAASDVRVTLDESDAGVLDLPTAGRTVDVRAVGMSGRMPLAVTVYEGERIVAARTVRAEVLVRREVVLAVNALRRGDLVGPGDITVESRWVAAGGRAAERDSVVGAAVKGRLVPGQVVEPSDIEPPIVVRKGEVIAVHCVVGSVVLRTTARATAPARRGEVIELESLAQDGRRFVARIDAPGRAVAIAPAERTPSGRRGRAGR